MTRKLNWLLALLVVTMLVAACGPDMVTPTPSSKPDDDWRVLGSADAPVTIVEYSDFQ